MKTFFSVLLLGLSSVVFSSAFQGLVFPMGERFFFLNDSERKIYQITEPLVQEGGRLIELYKRYAYYPGFPLQVTFRGTSEDCPTYGLMITGMISSTISIEEYRLDRGILGLDLTAYSQEEGWWMAGSNGYSLLFCDHDTQLMYLTWYTYPTLSTHKDGLVCEIAYNSYIGQAQPFKAFFLEDRPGTFVARIEAFDRVYQGKAYVLENRTTTLLSEEIEEDSRIVRIDVFDSPTFRGEGYLRVRSEKTYLLPFEHTFKDLWIEDLSGNGRKEILFAYNSGMASVPNLTIIERKDQGYAFYRVPLLQSDGRGESVTLENGMLIHKLPKYDLYRYDLLFFVHASYRYLGKGEWEISKPEGVPEELLLQVAHRTFYQQLEAILEILPDLEARDAQGRTALMLAAERNTSAEVMQILIDAGANIHATTPSGGTALMYAAAMNPNPQILRLLIDAGACKEARYENGMTPLMFAASHNPNLQVLTTLIQRRASIHAMGANGETALHHAAHSSINPQIIHALVDAGAHIHALDQLGYPPAAYAAGFNNNPEVLAALIEAGADIHQGYADGWTLLDIAIQFNNEPAIALLRSYGAEQ